MPHRDYEELLAAFAARRVQYLIGGAHAVALYARPRATKDLDVFVRPTRANAQRTVAAIRDFFGGVAPMYADIATLIDPDVIVQLGVAPVRVDLLSCFGAVSFASAWKRRTDAPFGRVRAHYLSLDDLIAEKAHWDRDQDRYDLRALQRAKLRQSSKPKRPIAK